MTAEIQKPKFVDYSGLPAIKPEKAECYWCQRVLDKDKMSKTRKYEVVVYVCRGCGG